MNRTRTRCLPLRLAALWLASLAVPALFADSLTIYDLGAALQTATGYSGKSYSMFINASGEVAGKLYTDSSASTYYTFLYNGTSVQNLGTFMTGSTQTGGNSAPTGLNNQGVVSGTAQVIPGQSPPSNAFLYEGGIMNDLGVLPLGGTNSSGYGVNDSGMANSYGALVGTSSINSTNSNIDVVTYTGTPGSGGTMNDLGGPAGAQFIYSDFINDNGQIAGNSNLSGSGEQAFYYSTSTGFTAATLISNGGSVATAIGANGEVIGKAQYSSGSGVEQAFEYDPVNGATNLGTAWSAGSSNSYIGASDALAINAEGEIVGQANVSATAYHAVIFSNGVMTDLGVLTGCTDSTAVAVNDLGWVVGNDTGCTGNKGAFLYLPASTAYPNGEMIDLTAAMSLGTGYSELLTATGINDLGEIIGQGQAAVTADAYILTYTSGVPEPSTFILMLSGLTLCTWFVNRRRRTY